MADAQKNLKIVIDWAQTGENIPGEARQQMEEIRKQSDLASSIGAASGMDQARKSMDFADMRKMTEAIKGGSEEWKNFSDGAEHSAHSMGRMLPMIGRMAGLPSELTHSIHMLERMAMIFGPIGIAAAGAGLLVKYHYDQYKEAAKVAEETTKQANEMALHATTQAIAFGFLDGKLKEHRDEIAALIQSDKDYIKESENFTHAVGEEVKMLELKEKYAEKGKDLQQGRKTQELDDNEKIIKLQREGQEIAIKARIENAQTNQQKVTAEKDLYDFKKKAIDEDKKLAIDKLKNEDEAAKESYQKNIDSIQKKWEHEDKKASEENQRRLDEVSHKDSMMDRAKIESKDHPELTESYKLAKEDEASIAKREKTIQEINERKKLLSEEGQLAAALFEKQRDMRKAHSESEKNDIEQTYKNKIAQLEQDRKKELKKEGITPVGKEVKAYEDAVHKFPVEMYKSQVAQRGAILSHLKDNNLDKNAIKLGGKLEIVVRTPDGNQIGSGVYDYSQPSDSSQTVTTDNAQNAGGYGQ